MIENAYLRKKEGGIEIDTGSGKKIYAYGGDIPEEKGFIGDIHLEKGKAIDVVTLENSGKDIIKKVDESNIFLEKQGNVSWDAHAKIYEEKGEKVFKKWVFTLQNLKNDPDFIKYREESKQKSSEKEERPFENSSSSENLSPQDKIGRASCRERV